MQTRLPIAVSNSALSHFFYDKYALIEYSEGWRAKSWHIHRWSWMFCFDTDRAEHLSETSSESIYSAVLVTCVIWTYSIRQISSLSRVHFTYTISACKISIVLCPDLQRWKTCVFLLIVTNSDLIIDLVYIVFRYRNSALTHRNFCMCWRFISFFILFLLSCIILKKYYLTFETLGAELSPYHG